MASHVHHDGTSTTARHFIFCTGIENSYPVITTRDGKELRRDGMALSGHYRHWRKDFDLVRDLGVPNRSGRRTPRQRHVHADGRKWLGAGGFGSGLDGG